MNYKSRLVQAVQFISDEAKNIKDCFNHYPDWFEDAAERKAEKTKFCIQCRSYPHDCCKDTNITYQWTIYIPDNGEICVSQWVIKLLNNNNSFLILDDEHFKDLWEVIEEDK